MKKIIPFFILLLTLNLNCKEIKLYPSKIIAESFLIEGKNVYGVEKLYDQNTKTSFSFGLNGQTLQEIIFYFDDQIELTSFEIVNGFQEKENYYEQNSRVNYLAFYTEDKNGNTNSFYFNLLDSKKAQKYKITLLKNEKINKVILNFDLTSVYKGSKYNDVCISEITFYGNDTGDLKINNNSKKLDNYFKSIKYNYNNDYSSFFNKTIDYQFNRGGKVKVDNNELTLEYVYPDLMPIENNGLRGKFKINRNELIFLPKEILVSKGSDEDYEINWESLKSSDNIVFLIEQEKCFIKLIPKGKYDILKPVLKYVNDWKQDANNAPKGDYIPIVIQ